MADDTEDVVESWEDVDTEVLERRMEERQKQQEKEKRRRMKQLQSNAPANNMKTKNEVAIMPLEVQTYLPLHTQDPGRTEYMAPIKILKRSTNSKEQQQPTAQSSTSSLVQRKSLAEREAEYASARARILGSDYQSSEDVSSSPSTSAKSNPKSHSRPHPPITYGISINRQPMGPNGTKGFKSKVKS